MKLVRCRLLSYVASALLVLSVFIAGCSKEESNPTNNSNTTSTQPSTPTVSISGPNTSSNDPYAISARSYAQMFGAVATQFVGIQGVAGNQSGNVWSYEMTLQGLTVKYQCVKNADGSVLWTITWNGTSGNNTYNNWKVCEAFSSADGKNGYYRVYVKNDTLRDGEYTWSTDANGTITGTFSEFTNGVENSRAVIIAHTDGTGNLTVSQKVTGVTGLVVKTYIVWQTNGSGTWTTYKNDGTIEATGTWT